MMAAILRLAIHVTGNRAMRRAEPRHSSLPVPSRSPAFFDVYVVCVCEREGTYGLILDSGFLNRLIELNGKIKTSDGRE